MIAVARDLFLVLVALRLDLHLAWTIPELVLPFAAPLASLPALVLPLVIERRRDDAEANDQQDAQNGPRAHLITPAET
jgi:hypothetical protein